MAPLNINCLLSSIWEGRGRDFCQPFMGQGACMGFMMGKQKQNTQASALLGVLSAGVALRPAEVAVNQRLLAEEKIFFFLLKS